MEVLISPIFNYFRCYVNIAISDINLNIVIEKFLVIFLNKKFLHFLNIEVTCYSVIIVFTN